MGRGDPKQPKLNFESKKAPSRPEGGAAGNDTIEGQDMAMVPNTMLQQITTSLQHI